MQKVKIQMKHTHGGQDVDDYGRPLPVMTYYSGQKYEVSPMLAQAFGKINSCIVLSEPVEQKAVLENAPENKARRPEKIEMERQTTRRPERI